jgi:putative DNA primase/helicase
MRTAAEILREFGLPPPPSGEDRYYTRCPKCSAGRARAHQHVKCLGITIGDNGVHFGCNHCGWKDGGYFNGKTNCHARSDSDRFVAVYDYTDENGGLLFQVCRKAGKQFPQRRPNGRGGWIWNTADVRKVLYRLPELTEAIATERTVLIVEGEKDVESLRKLNVPATCNPGGASGPGQQSKWKSEYSEFLHGADIIIVPDNDDPGRAHADAIARMSAGIVKRIRILNLAQYWPDCPKGGDISDWLAAGHSREELDNLIEQAQEPELCERPALGKKAHLISRCAAEIEPKRIDFLWPGRVARGKHTAIAGEPGDGKSQLSVYVAATISRGGEWPCGEGSAPIGNVIILNAEDGADDTVVPRLIAAGADRKRIHIVSAVRQEDGKGRRAFNLQADLALLERKIAEIGDVVLVIIDPISSYMGKADSHKNAEVRGALEPLSEMAERLKVAILSITHFSKSGAGNNNKALHRFIGSIAFVGAPRAAFAVIEDADNEGRILFLHAKNNMAGKPQGLAYRLVQTLVGENESIVASYVVWDTNPVVVSADEALRANDGGGDPTAATEAEEFLQDKLSAGAVPAKDAEEHARAIGIAPRTLRRARKKLGVIAEKAGLKEGWNWRLPPEGGQVSPKAAIKNNGPLRPSLAPFGSALPAAPPCPPAKTATAGNLWDDDPELAKGIPDFLLRALPVAESAPNDRAPALGPPGDSLDDFK